MTTGERNKPPYEVVSSNGATLLVVVRPSGVPEWQTEWTGPEEIAVWVIAAAVSAVGWTSQRFGWSVLVWGDDGPPLLKAKYRTRKEAVRRAQMVAQADSDLDHAKETLD